MKIVIPFLYDKIEISVDSHKLLLTTLKSYIFNGNTTPLIIAITHDSTKQLLDRFIANENCSNVISYQFFDKAKVFDDMSEYSHFKHMYGRIARSKVFCVRNVAKDDDIIIIDSDMLFLKNVDWTSHIKPNAKVQYYENYYLQGTCCSSNIGIFVNRCAKDLELDPNKYLKELQNSSKIKVDPNTLWPNGGTVYFSKQYRNTEFEKDYAGYKASNWYNIHLFEEEPFYVYLMHNTDNICVEDKSSLNKRIYFWTNTEIYDLFNIPNTDMIHFCLPKCKPTEYQFAWMDGKILRNTVDSIFGCSVESSIWNEFFTRSGTTKALLLLWHYYYSYVAYYIAKPDEIIHQPSVFLKVLKNFKISNDNLYETYNPRFE